MTTLNLSHICTPQQATFEGSDRAIAVEAIWYAINGSNINHTVFSVVGFLPFVRRTLQAMRGFLWTAENLCRDMN